MQFQQSYYELLSDKGELMLKTRYPLILRLIVSEINALKKSQSSFCLIKDRSYSGYV
jgi:hypothetical protein